MQAVTKKSFPSDNCNLRLVKVERWKGGKVERWKGGATAKTPHEVPINDH